MKRPNKQDRLFAANLSDGNASSLPYMGDAPPIIIAYVRLGWKGLTGTNALAFLAHSSVIIF